MHPSPIYNSTHRVVSENYLEAMLADMSMMCQRYWIEKVTDSFCYVAFSNPNEYGNESPVQVMFPVYRMHAHAGTVLVVLDPYNAIGGRDYVDRDTLMDSIVHMLDQVPPLTRLQDGEWVKIKNPSVESAELVGVQGEDGWYPKKDMEPILSGSTHEDDS